ncbi:hypothetical protein RyT2_29590 [Pseudolactococcus yaeyamensis]
MGSSIKKVKRTEKFTQLANTAIRDKRLTPNGLSVLTYLDMVEKMVGSINPETGKPYRITKKEISERFGQKRCDSGWLNLINSGYLISFKKYSSNQNEYNYVFDDMKFEELESGEFDLLTEFKSQYEDGYIWFSSMIAQPKNRTKELIAASLPSNIDDEEREQLSQWIWERIPQAQDEVSVEESATIKQTFSEIEAQNTPVVAKPAPSSEADKLAYLEQQIDDELPEYRPLFDEVERRLPKTANQYIVKNAVVDSIYNMMAYLDMELPQFIQSMKPSGCKRLINLDTGEIEHDVSFIGVPEKYWSPKQEEMEFITRFISKQFEITEANLKNHNKYDDYFVNGLENLFNLTKHKLSNNVELDF